MLNFGCMGLGRPELRAMIVCPSERVASMNGVVVQTQAPMSFLREADAVLIGSGIQTREVVKTPSLMEELKLDPSRQIIGSQCSGALVLAKLGLLAGVPACTDSTSKAWVQDAGVDVLDRSSHAGTSRRPAVACRPTTWRRGLSRACQVGRLPKASSTTWPQLGKRRSKKERIQAKKKSVKMEGVSVHFLALSKSGSIKIKGIPRKNSKATGVK